MKTTKCKSCGTSIKFIKLKTGKLNPVNLDKYLSLTLIDPEEINPDKTIVVSENGEVGKLSKLKNGYISHFSTCPAAKNYRK